MSKIFIVFLALGDKKSQIEFCLPEATISENGDWQLILAATESRIIMCLKPIHLAVYLLDPSNQGAKLTESQEIDAIEFNSDLGQNIRLDIMRNLASYKAKDGLCSRRFLWQNLNDIKPLVWWKGLCGSTQLSKFAVRILTAPCASAAVERSFST